MKVAFLLLGILAGSCYWLWATRPQPETAISDERLKSSLTAPAGARDSLQSALARMTEPKSAEPPAPARIEPPADMAPAPVAMGDAPGAYAEIESAQDPSRKIAAIRSKLDGLEPSQFPARMELVSHLFSIQAPQHEAAGLALEEMSSSNPGIRDAPNDWKRVYVDHLMKAYLTHAGTSDGMASLAQKVESEADPAFRQLLEERFAVNRIPDLERRPAAQ